jgi:hypothetical protein
MKRGFLALAILVGLTVTSARADYIIIIANLGQKKAEPPGRPGAGMVGNVGQFGQFGVTGLPPGGMAGDVGGPGSGATGIPPGGMAGQRGMAGAFGVRGGPPGGMAGAFGARGGPPGGMTGAMGGPPGGMTGAMGGPPMGFEGGFGFAGAQGSEGNVTQLRVMAVLELKSPLKPHDQQSGKVVTADVQHKWGSSRVLVQTPITQTIRLMTKENKPLAAISKQYEAERAKVLKEKPDTDRLLRLAEWALTHGLVKEFTKLMDELAVTDKSNPRVALYLKVKAALEKPVTRTDAAAVWKQKLGTQYNIAEQGHYALLHQNKTETPEVKSRLARLEEQFQGVYYWFALKGKELPVPQERLVSVLIAGGRQPGEDFLRHNEIFDSPQIVNDSFLARRENLVVYSAERLDQPYEALSKHSDELWKEFSRDEVLRGKYARTAHYDRAVTAMTMSLMLKALEDEAELAAVSHEGARQILTASGLLPRNLIAPEWAQSGFGSLFETPEGSLWSGIGAPHWMYYFSYHELLARKKLPKAAELLRDVVTDRYFREGKDKIPSVKARATAWSLLYFLAQHKLDGLLRYYQELAKLPRDLPLDDEVLLDCFARAFDCVEQNKRSDRKLASLASEWVNVMNAVPIDAKDLMEQIYKVQSELEKELKEEPKPSLPPTGPGPGPGRPGFPGPGFPGGTGPGAGK